MTKMSEQQLHALLAKQRIRPLDGDPISVEGIRIQVKRRRKRRLLSVSAFVLPVGLLAMGAGNVYQDITQQEVQTHHYLYAITSQQFTHITHGSTEMQHAYYALTGWLQTQLSWNPGNWDTAPFKSYKVLDVSPNGKARAIASIRVLLQNGQWVDRQVPLSNVSGSWKVTIPKYGEPTGSRYVTVPGGGG